MKRCKFCAKKLGGAGYCSNTKCPENLRCEIAKKAENKEKKR